MRERLISITVLLLLVLGMFSYIPLITAESQPGVSEEGKGEEIVKVLTLTIEKVKELFKSWGLPEDDPAWNELKALEDEVSAVSELVSEEKYVEAKLKVKEILTTLSELVKDVASRLGKDVELSGFGKRIRRLLILIKIVKRAIDRLEFIARRLNITEALELLNEAKSKLLDAIEALLSGRFIEARQLLREAIELVKEARRVIYESLIDIIRERLSAKINGLIERIENEEQALDEAVEFLNSKNLTEVASAVEVLKGKLNTLRERLSNVLENASSIRVLIHAYKEGVKAYVKINKALKVIKDFLTAAREFVEEVYIKTGKLIKGLRYIANTSTTLDEEDLILINETIDNVINVREGVHGLITAIAQCNNESIDEIHNGIVASIDDAVSNLEVLKNEVVNEPNATKIITFINRSIDGLNYLKVAIDRVIDLGTKFIKFITWINELE
ncbi:MAG TPA: hypothetical protein ENF75_06965 [Acidilobales archaeon]|nr:hypothetical protein [Acidilobales archaeon]